MDMEFLAEALINGYVLGYLLIVVTAQLILALGHYARRRWLARRRQKQGLPPHTIMDHTQRLSESRREAALEAGTLLLTVVLVPFLMAFLALDAEPTGTTQDSTTQAGLALTFIALLLWVLLNGTDVAKAFLGGLAFKTLVAFHNPFQVGDRVTLKGHSGKVTHLGTFFVTLQTIDDDLINLPTRDLWSEVLVSANAGERSSLCVMAFYLDPRVSQSQRQAAEDAIWDAVQSSTYFEPAKPMQIHLTQEPTALCLTANRALKNGLLPGPFPL